MTLGLIVMLLAFNACSPAPSPAVERSDGNPGAGALRLRDVGFFRIAREGDSTNLEVGTLDGTMAERLSFDDEAQQPGDGGQWASGPQGDLVLYGTGNQLFVVDVKGRDQRQILEAPGRIHSGALSPDGRIAYFAVREDGAANWSLWRILVAGGDPQRLRGPLADSVARRGIVLAAPLAPRAQVAVSPDGRTVALNECLTNCRLFLLDVPTGTSQQLDAVESVDNMGGVVGDRLLPVSGDVAVLGSDGRAYIVRGAVVVDVETGDERVIATENGRQIIEGAVVSSWWGVELPPGWSLAVEALPPAPVTDEGCARFVAMNIETGDLVELPALGKWPLCQ